MQAFTAGLSGGFFLPVTPENSYWTVAGKKMAPCAVTLQGAGSVQDYRRSSIIPFVTKIGGQKTGK